MKFYTRHIVFLLFLSAFSFFADGQIYVRASVDRDSILIGEPIRLSLEATIPMGAQAGWFPTDSIPHFEILQKGKTDSSQSIDGHEVTQTLTITSFDSGHWQIPSVSLVVSGKTYSTDPVPITVAYTPVNQAQDYHDIREIIDIPNPYRKYIPWIIGLVTLLAIGGAVYWLRRREKVVVVPSAPVITLSPYEEAMQALESLLKKNDLQNGQVKIYYTQLNEILRTYLHRQLHISTLEKTNEELIVQLKKVPLSATTYDQLAEALRISDFVKFAKYQPLQEENDRNFEIVKTTIRQLHISQQAVSPAEQNNSL